MDNIYKNIDKKISIIGEEIIINIVSDI